MRLKLDENLPRSLLAPLRQAGHDATTAREEGLSGSPDRDVLARAGTEQRVLVTLDRGFANVHRYPLESHSGIVVLRLGVQGPAALHAAVGRLVDSGLLTEFGNGLAVVEEARIRIRRPRSR